MLFQFNIHSSQKYSQFYFISIIELTFILMVFYSCSTNLDKTELKPVLPEKTMIQVVGDIHLAEVVIRETPEPNRTNEASALYNRVFQIHGITKDNYENDLKYYLASPKRSSAFYKKVGDYLAEQQVKFEH